MRQDALWALIHCRIISAVPRTKEIFVHKGSKDIWTIVQHWQFVLRSFLANQGHSVHCPVEAAAALTGTTSDLVHSPADPGSLAFHDSRSLGRLSQITPRHIGFVSTSDMKYKNYSYKFSSRRLWPHSLSNIKSDWVFKFAPWPVRSLSCSDSCSIILHKQNKKSH